MTTRLQDLCISILQTWEMCKTRPAKDIWLSSPLPCRCSALFILQTCSGGTGTSMGATRYDGQPDTSCNPHVQEHDLLLGARHGAMGNHLGGLSSRMHGSSAISCHRWEHGMQLAKYASQKLDHCLLATVECRFQQHLHLG